MKTLFTILMILINYAIFPQAPDEEWQNTIGGANIDELTDIVVANDGGFLIIGFSTSDISGDKTENSIGSGDYWVVKIDATGELEWDKTYGGTSSDIIQRGIQTIDGGFILLGHSNSEISGNKTENSLGGFDYWVIKITDAGIIEWQNTIGGSNSERAQSISQTSDGGYIIGGVSNSDASGDKTENSNGGNDFWILKLDASGSIVWQNTIGGSGDDSISSIIQTIDGGYVMTGFSNSDISGDKTENSQGGRDFWVVKTNVNGNIEWDNTIGGMNSDQANEIIQTTDGNYIVAGWSSSDVSGDKTDPSNGQSDFWVVKIDSNNQSIIWQNSIGGSEGDFLDNITATADGNFILGGDSSSEISGDKTEPVRNSTDIWGVKINNLGNVIWNKTLGSKFDNDEPARVYPTNDGGYIYGSGANWEIFGDKTEEGINMSTDLWVIKLETESLGVNDENLNGINIYPNPIQEIITINLNGTYNHIDVTINDLLGKQIIFQTFNNAKTIDLNLDIPSGIYIFKIDNHKDINMAYKIIKK